MQPTATATTANQPAAGIALRPFTAHDWLGFAGAEPFADQAAPLIAEGEFAAGEHRGWLLVLDYHGACLVVDGDPKSDYGGYVLQHRFSFPEDATAWVREHLASATRLDHFLAAGFAAL
jgi:hypothetical protein